MFEVLEHPADIGFRTWAATLDELFANAAIALLSIAGDPSAAQPRNRYPMEVESPDLESLLVDWLNEVLYWWDGRRIAFHSFQVTVQDRNRVRAEGLGEPQDRARHAVKLVVKAVTYHQLRVEHCEGRWVAEVYLDI